MKRDEVDSNRSEDAKVKGDPKPDARRHGGETFMRRGARQLRKVFASKSQIATDAWTTYTSHESCISQNG